MQVYRLAKEQYIRDLSGTGARIYGGRWNAKGTSMLYASEHCSLAVLELMVHTPHNLLPDEMSLLTLSIPDHLRVAEIEKDQLPTNWQQYPAPNALADIGSKWIEKRDEVGIGVPSVLVPDEHNILLNPEHEDFHKISIESVSPFQLDSRF